jgi:hypothetical protein
MSISPQPIRTPPDPDVGGPGETYAAELLSVFVVKLTSSPQVMVGFILTGLLATLASCGSALLSSLGDSDKPTSSDTPWWRTAALWVLKALSPDDAEDPVEFWAPILEGFVLNLSDQQLVTGLFLVTLSCAKYFTTDHSSLSVAGDLAFFSIITHYATFLIIQRMLREHFKLALLRVVLIFITFVIWLTMEAVTSLTQFDSLKYGLRFLPFLALFSSLIEACGFVWAFWGICLSLSATDLTLRARRAIGRGDLENDIDRQLIDEWLENSKHDHSLPKSTFDHVTFPLKRSLSWLFQKLVRKYMTTKSEFLGSYLWIATEIVFPFRLGYLLGLSLFCLGIINLSIDLSESGLISTWGFGQLLAPFMVIIPFLSLIEAYARK